MKFNTPFILGSLFSALNACLAAPSEQRSAATPYTLVELVSFPSSPAFLANQSILNGPLDELKKIEGYVIDTYYGIQIEDGQTGYVLAVWKDKYPMEREPASALKKLIAPAASGEIDVQHVKPNGDPSQVFTAPATELTTLNLLPGKTEAELAPLLEQLRVMLDDVTGQYGHSHWGPVVEIPGEFRNFVGWASVQAHTDLTSTPAFQAQFAKIQEIIAGVARHAHLTKY